MSDITATVVVDTASCDAESGMRALGLTDRRVLYRVPGGHVELRVMDGAAGQADARWLFGMWLDDEAVEADLRVEQLHDELPPTHIASGQRANFAMLVQPGEPVTLRLQKADRAPVVLTLEANVA